MIFRKLWVCVIFAFVAGNKYIRTGVFTVKKRPVVKRVFFLAVTSRPKPKCPPIPLYPDQSAKHVGIMITLTCLPSS